MTDFTPQVLLDSNARPLIVFRKGRVKYHAVAAGDTSITLVELDSLRYYRPLERNGVPYPPKRAASRWLNHDHRTITKRAERVLKSLVARKGKQE